MPDYTLAEYTQLLESFLNNQISANKFEQNYLVLFKNDSTIRPEAEFLILDRLFASVDAFCSDTELCDEGDLNEDQLRQECREGLRAIRELNN